LKHRAGFAGRLSLSPPDGGLLNILLLDLASCTTLNYVTDGVTDSQHSGEASQGQWKAKSDETPATPPPPAALFLAERIYLEGHRPPGGWADDPRGSGGAAVV
jgi:hypothetical protein